MLSKLKAVLALLSVAGIASKFAGLFGPVGAIVGAAATFVLQIVKWFFEGVTVVVSNPVTLVTVAVCSALAFGGGVKLGREYDQYLVDRKDAVIQKMLADSKRLDNENKVKLKSALEAKSAAEAAAKVEAKPVATTSIAPIADKPAPVAAKRVRKPRTDCSNGAGGSGLYFGPLFGGPAPCNP